MEHHVALNFIGIQWWNDRNNLIFIGWRYKKELIVVIGRNSLNFLAECFIEACILVATVEITWTILSRRVSLFIGYEDIGFGRKYGPFRGYQLFNIFSMCLAGYLSYLNLKNLLNHYSLLFWSIYILYIQNWTSSFIVDLFVFTNGFTISVPVLILPIFWQLLLRNGKISSKCLFWNEGK